MEVKGSEPPDSPPPPYPGYAPAPQPGVPPPEAYYPPGQYAPYDPRNPQYGPGNVQYDPSHGHYAPGQGQYAPGQPYAQYYASSGGVAGGPVTSARHVILAQPQSGSCSAGGLVEVAAHKPQSYLALSMVTCLCFSPFFGLIAICFSAASHSAYEHGDVLAAKRHGTTALLLCIFGIVLSLVILVIVLTAGVQWKPD